jgi:enoyl-CoA hydratase/carnithine racemase
MNDEDAVLSDDAVLSEDPVLFALDGPVARVTLNRPEAMNSLSPALLAGLSQAVDAAVDARCSVLVIRGAQGTLSAGADLKYLRSCLGSPDRLRDYITSIGAVFDAIEAAPIVSVCVVDGYAVAGGCELLLACDIPIASTTARIGDRHLEYGLLPGAGGSVRLTRAIPRALASRLCYTADLIDGETAFRYGLVSAAVPPGELDPYVDQIVSRLARHSLPALQAMKHLIHNASVKPAQSALADEREVLLRHLGAATVAEGLAAFAERRPPDFAGLHDPAFAHPTEAEGLAI